MPLLVTQGSWTKQIENPFDSDNLDKFAEAVLECWRFICKIWVGVGLEGFLLGGRGGGKLIPATVFLIPARKLSI